MSLNKRTYTDLVTVITADYLNDIQDEIIANEQAINSLGNLADLEYEEVTT